MYDGGPNIECPAVFGGTAGHGGTKMHLCHVSSWFLVSCLQPKQLPLTLTQNLKQELTSHRCILPTQRSSDGLNLKLPTEMAEIKVAKKKNVFPGKESWSSPQIIPQGYFHIGEVLINKYGLKT